MQDIDSLLVPVYKPVGKTPLECVEEYKSKHLLDPNITVSYAGRLDPMAEGVLLLLIGDANKKRREYEHLSKEYEVTVLVGFATDTGDLMGKITQIQDVKCKMQNYIEKIKNELKGYVGTTKQKYPIYSSAKVRGRPLYWWARQGRPNEIEIPSHKVQIDTIELISESSITNELLLKYIVVSVGSVQGDFRQDEIITEWQEVLREENNFTNHSLFTLHITCGSGTYMRQLVTDIGEKLNVPLVAFKIKRTGVGRYTVKNCMRLEIASSLDNSSQ